MGETEIPRFIIAKTLADEEEPGANERFMASLILVQLAKSGYEVVPYDRDASLGVEG